MDIGAWWATVHGVAKSRTWLSDGALLYYHHHHCHSQHLHHSQCVSLNSLWVCLVVGSLLSYFWTLAALNTVLPQTAEIPNKQCLNDRINNNEFIHSTLQLNWVSEWVSGSRSVVSDSLRPHGLYSPWNSPGQNTGVGSLSLLQGIFPTQGWNPGIPHCRRILYQLSHKGSPRILEWVAYPFSCKSSWPRNRTRVSCIAGRFFTNWTMREAQLN